MNTLKKAQKAIDALISDKSICGVYIDSKYMQQVSDTLKETASDIEKEQRAVIIDKIELLYLKSGLINDDFTWSEKLFELITLRMWEAAEIYESLNKSDKEEILDTIYEIDNDMGSFGDGKMQTSKNNLRILLKDAKQNKPQ